MKRIALILALLILFTCSFACADEWICPDCGKTNSQRFCTSCGLEHDIWVCPECGSENDDSFCGNCGTKRPSDEILLFGTWLFFNNDVNLILALNEDHTCIIKTQDILVKGTFEAANNMLTVSFDHSFKLFDSQEYASVFSSRYKVTQNNLSYEPFGAGTKTDIGLDRFYMTMAGSSMDDTIANGTFLSFRFASAATLKRFDIVAVNYPGRGGTVFVKRLVGLPGDEVSIVDGYLYVNGILYDEPYINDEYRTGYLNNFKPYTVPEGRYFVLGDHRNNSNDSRSVGPLSANMILGVLDQ